MRDADVTGVQTCALPIYIAASVLGGSAGLPAGAWALATLGASAAAPVTVPTAFMNRRRDIRLPPSSPRASSAIAALHEKTKVRDMDERFSGFSGATVSDRLRDRQRSRMYGGFGVRRRPVPIQPPTRAYRQAHGRSFSRTVCLPSAAAFLEWSQFQDSSCHVRPSSAPPPHADSRPAVRA